MPRPPRSLLVPAAVSLLVTSCVSTDETPVSDLGDATPTGTPASDAAEMNDFDFRVPEPLEPGQELVIVNTGDLPHTFTIEAQDIDTGIVAAGGEAAVTLPGEPGTYQVVCTLHRIQMRTTIEVG